MLKTIQQACDKHDEVLLKDLLRKLVPEYQKDNVAKFPPVFSGEVAL
jgi:hypothetical protein